ncbi:MAG: hypothetical protein WKF57_04115 [Nakamurella sp.]
MRTTASNLRRLLSLILLMALLVAGAGCTPSPARTATPQPATATPAVSNAPAAPPSAIASSTLPARNVSELPPSTTTTAAPSAEKTQQLQLLRPLAASVASHPLAGVFTDSTSTPDGHAWTYSRTRKVRGELSVVFTWYREFYPRAVVVSPVVNGLAELQIAPASEANLAAYEAFSQVQVIVVFAAAGQLTQVTVRASGTPRLPGDTDRIPAAQVVSATLGWFDGSTTRGGTQKLDSEDSQAAVAYLNAAPLFVPETSTGLPSASAYVLTLTTNTGQVFKAEFNTSMPGFGVALTIESVGQVWLDVDPAYSSLIRRLART